MSLRTLDLRGTTPPYEAVLPRPTPPGSDVHDVVAGILRQVRAEGDEALVRLTSELDKVDVSDEKDVVIDMTLTAPGCPVAGEMPDWVRDAVLTVPDLKSCAVNLVFDPPWDPSRMSDEAKLQLNMF